MIIETIIILIVFLITLFITYFYLNTQKTVNYTKLYLINYVDKHPIDKFKEVIKYNDKEISDYELEFRAYQYFLFENNLEYNYSSNNKENLVIMKKITNDYIKKNKVDLSLRKRIKNFILFEDK